jgi:hypothetical protein
MDDDVSVVRVRLYGVRHARASVSQLRALLSDDFEVQQNAADVRSGRSGSLQEIIIPTSTGSLELKAADLGGCSGVGSSESGCRDELK